MSVTDCSDALLDAVTRLNPVLQPLGFSFAGDANGEGHMDFASGFFVGDAVKIGLIFRMRGRLGCVIYENAHSSMSHDDLMRYLGAEDRQQLIYRDSRMESQAKGGGDPIDALIFDLRELVGPRLADRDLLAQFIARSLHERFPWLAKSGSAAAGESRAPGERVARRLIRRLLHMLGFGRSLN